MKFTPEEESPNLVKLQKISQMERLVREGWEIISVEGSQELVTLGKNSETVQIVLHPEREARDQRLGN